MKDFKEFFLMTTEDAKRYAVEVLGRFRPDEKTDCIEIGDGNINYVFKIWSEEDGHSVIVKQADRLLRSAGRPLDQYRNKIEAEILRLEGELAPGYVPEVYYYDEIMSAVSMEDISAYGNLRKVLMAGNVYDHLAENFSTFVAETLLPTTDLVLAADEKKKRVKFFTNPELCEITERLVLTEPFYDFRGENKYQSENAAFVEETLYNDDALKVEVGKLRERFMNNAQALIHGDLHSGSIFANENGIKVIDPEFAFYCPMGYDIGNLVGNLYFTWANKAFTAAEDTAVLTAIEETIRKTVDLTWEKMSAKYDELVEYPFYKIPAFKEAYLAGVMADTFGYAGTEIIRRTVGSSKVMELNTVTDPATRAAMERALVKVGVRFVKERESLRTGEDAVRAFRAILAE
ncbi:MAG: S-methyl-5-thioribose kinase [Oscillibacter sp.]|nr:S-methyl-5-thioribose kinase [Oscillibacter sp.]